MRRPNELPDDPSLRDLLVWVEGRRLRARARLRTHARLRTQERDRGISMPAASSVAVPGTVLSLDTIAEGLIRFTVAKPPGFAFQPGDSVKLELDGVRRRYSIVSAPHEPHLEFFVELVPGGRMSARFAALRVGMRLGVDGGAKAGLRLEDGARRHLMLATVTGVNPFVSILRHAVHLGRRDLSCVLVHGASHGDELGYAAELAALAARRPDLLAYVPTVSRPAEARNAGWSGATGRAETHVAALLARFRLRPGDTAAYACGNPGMIKAAQAVLGGLGYRIHTESYG